MRMIPRFPSHEGPDYALALRCTVPCQMSRKEILVPMVNQAKSRSLKSGRPPLAHGSLKHNTGINVPGLAVNARQKSAKATRSLINKHHQLHKSRAAAVAAGNQTLVDELDSQLVQLGGLEAYQAASLTGQDRDRGGDSSEKLVEWLHKHKLVGPDRDFRKELKVLEIGALSSKNAISAMIGKGIETVKRIDLHSQEPDLIEQADFMTFPTPAANQKYDIVSLSLVLNYVPDIVQRGQMLRRTTQFLRPQIAEFLPCLFLVLPLPCLTNSRYMTQEHLKTMMESLGYELLESHHSTKLAYMLFRWDSIVKNSTVITKAFKKVEINPGRTRNNFAVVLEA